MYTPAAKVDKIDQNFRLEDKIAEVDNAISQDNENHSPKVPEETKPKIQKVPNHLREPEQELNQNSVAAAYPKHQNKVVSSFYTPKMISIGPIHHHLKLGEEHKLRWTAKHVKKVGQSTRQLYQKIRDDINALKKLFVEEVIRDYDNDDYLSWMLFIDGCSLLYFMEHDDKNNQGNSLGIKYDQLIYMSRDLILLENQLPYKVLVLLNWEQSNLLEIMGKYVFDCIYNKRYYMRPGSRRHGQTSSTSGQKITTNNIQGKEPPVHLLGLVRAQILAIIGQKEEPVKEKLNSKLLDFDQNCFICKKRKTDAMISPTYKNIQDLKAAKIGVKKAKEGHGISYNHRLTVFGDLEIPEFRVDDTTAVLVLNVIAFEMCPDFQNHYVVSSFVAFLESIIDDAEDVKELRKAGVINNVLGSDEEVAQLFNSLSSDLVVEDIEYFDVKQQIELHYSHRARTWIAEFLDDHFNSPWTCAAFAAAVFSGI